MYTVSLTAASAAGRDTRVRTNYISVPELGAVLQLLAGCLGLWGLNARRGRRRRGAAKAEG